MSDEANTAPESLAGDASIQPNGFPDPTPNEAMFFYAIIRNSKTKPDIDWEGVARDTGLKNASVASVRDRGFLAFNPAMPRANLNI
jgi:hypothetical protein